MSRSLHTCNREVNALINQQKTQSQSRRSRLPGCCSISNRLVAWLMRWPSGWKKLARLAGVTLSTFSYRNW